MKLFLIKIAAFFCLLLLFSIPLDYFLSFNLKKSLSFAEGEFVVWNDIYASKIKADLYIYGSSRAWVQIDPQVLEDSLGLAAYNFGMDGQSFEIEYLRHQEILKHNAPPRHILFSLDVFTLEKPKGLYNADQFLPYMFFNSTVEKYTSSYQGFNCLQFRLPLLRYFGKKQAMTQALKNTIFSEHDVLKRTKGFLGMDKTWNQDFDRAQSKLEYYEVVLDPKVIQLFKTFIENCQRTNTYLIFVYTPEYKAGQAFVKNRKEVFALYNAMANQYGIPFIDYSDDPICEDKNNFYNASHLNKQAADLFTRKLAQDLKKLGVMR